MHPHSKGWAIAAVEADESGHRRPGHELTLFDRRVVEHRFPNEASEPVARLAGIRGRTAFRGDTAGRSLRGATRRSLGGRGKEVAQALSQVSPELPGQGRATPLLLSSEGGGVVVTAELRTATELETAPAAERPRRRGRPAQVSFGVRAVPATKPAP